jgi:hypothetical protein
VRHPGQQPRLRVPTPAAVERRRAEDARLIQAREAAARLDAAEPAWHVMYRAGARELMAVAMWDPGFALLLTDTDPHALVIQMRAAEQQSAQARNGLDALAALAFQPRNGAESKSPDRRGSLPGLIGRQQHGQFRAGD